MPSRRSQFAFILLLTCLACFAQEPTPASTLAELHALLRSKQYDQVLAVTAADLKKEPADYRLWTVQGIALSLKGDTAGALTSFDKAIHLSPAYIPALKGEVQILFQSSDLRAVPLLERLIKADPRDVVAHEMLATLERKRGNCRGAIEQFQLAAEAIKMHPESLEAYGSCLFETEQVEKAIPVFEQLIALLPDRPYPKYDLAVVQVAAKQNDAAIKTLEPLLSDDQNDPDILSLASQAYESVKNTPRAVALLRRAIVASPKTSDYYAAFAILCLEHDSFKVGVDMMNVGLKNIPGDASLYLSRGLLYVELAQFDKAESDFAQVEKLSSFQALGSYALDLVAVQKNNPEEALAKVRSQLKTHPADPLLNYFLAQSLMNQSPDADTPAFDEAMRAALNAEKFKPDYVPVHDLLASMYLHATRYSEAVEECRTALRYDPSDETATYHLLMALKHTGQTEELAALSKRLAQLHRESLQRENQRKSFRLIEADTAPSSVLSGASTRNP